MADDIASVVAEARAAENETHTDTCKVTRPDPDSPGVWDPVEGVTEPGEITVHDGLPCRVRAPSAADRQSVAGEHQFAEGDAVWRVDAGTTGIRVGDTVTITATPQGVGLVDKFTVIWPIYGSHMSAAKFVIRKVL